MMKSFGWFALPALLLCSAAAGWAQQAAPQAAEPKVAEPKASESKAVGPKPAPGSLEEMVRGHRDARWKRARADLRAALSEAGFEDKALQDAILSFVEEQDLAREELRAIAARCSEALRDRDVAEAEITRLLESYQAASAQALARREAALVKLEEKVRWKSNPRLQMLLRLRGVLGSEAWLAGDTLGESTDSFDLRVLYPPAQQ